MGRAATIGGRRWVDLFTVLGFIGVAAIVGAYFANQQGWLSAKD